MKKIYSTPVSVETKTRIRASILAGSNPGLNISGKSVETVKVGNTNGASQPALQNQGGKIGFFGE